MVEAIKRYKAYEFIRDSKEITPEMSMTKLVLIKLMQNDKDTKKYCNTKMLEEKREVEEALCGNHFHKNMTKREILVNEISQYMYWQTIIAIANKTSCDECNEIKKISSILKKVDLKKICEKEPITIKEIIVHDLKQMARKHYLKGVI